MGFRHTVLTAGVVSLISCLLVAGCSSTRSPQAAQSAQARELLPAAAGPEQQRLAGAQERAPVTPPGIVTISVPATLREVPVRAVPPTVRAPQNLVLTEVPEPAYTGPLPRAQRWPGETGSEAMQAPPGGLAKVLETSFDSTDYVDNIVNTGGWAFIPPDPIAAAGTGHLVNVVNVTVRFHQKDGTLDFDDSLQNFFTAESPANFTFDPKVIYDQFEDRFVIVTLEKTDEGNGDPADTSRILLAVSDDGDPNGTWYTTSWNSKVTIGVETWADYPGFAVDQVAVYISTSMYGFSSTGGNFRGSRQWVVDKGTAAGLYAGGSASISVFDLFTSNGAAAYATTTQPAHMFGTSPFSSGSGTYFTSFSGLTDGTNEYLEVMYLDDPLGTYGTPTTGNQFINLGNIDDLGGADLVDAPQSGTTTRIEVNDRRTLHSVWRNDSMWVTTTIDPQSGHAEDGEATAYWLQLDATTPGSVSVADRGTIGGEDIATSTWTFFPSVGVNEDGDAVFGYAASAGSIYAGAYYSPRHDGDAAGSVRTAETLRAGTDFYQRTFGGSRNRWGDYTGVALDPVTECFWVYNQYAMTRGNGTAPEDGRWATAYGLTCACTDSVALVQNEWKMLSLPCDMGDADTVQEVLGGELDTADYNTTWAVIQRDADNQQYVTLDLTDTMLEGVGYWIKTTETGKTIQVEGSRNQFMDTALVSNAAGRQNLAGHPFDYNVCWADVTVWNGSTALSLDQADPVVGVERACEMADPLGNGCVMSRVGNIWNGSAYQAFDGETVGMEGELTPFDGVWVKAFDSGISLRIPEQEGCTSKAPAIADGWIIRLVASAAGMSDPGNVFGRVAESIDGRDRHDLEELVPFDDRFLTVVFPHDDWGDRSGDRFTSDLREVRPAAGGGWDLEIRSDTSREVTLNWYASGTAAAEVLQRSFLHDLISGETIRPIEGGSYSLTVIPGGHPLRWQVNSLPVVQADAELVLPETGRVDLVVPFSDEDAADSHTATIDWGDGSQPEPAVVDPGMRTAAGTHTYPAAGNYQVRLCVSDDLGGVGCDTLAVVPALFYDDFETGDHSRWSHVSG